MRKGLMVRLIAVAACLLVATQLVPLSAGRLSPSVSTGTGAPEKWAYGYQEWSNNTVLSSTYLLTYTSYYASEVVTTATNTSNSTIQLEGTWNWAYSYDYLYCAPNCSAPTTSYNLTLSEWGASHMFTNTTSTASVKETKGPAPALGVQNGSYVSSSNYSERYLYIYNGSTVYKGVAFTGTNSSWFAQFSPALGMIPWNLSKNLTWNSTSSVFTGAESQSKYLYVYQGYGENSISRGDAYSKYTLPSNETVNGRDLGNVTLSNGQSASNVSLAYTGPFYVAYGLFYAPQSATVFGGATQNWSVGVLYGTLPATPAVYVRGSLTGGLYRVVGGITSWNTQVTAVGVPPVTTASGGSHLQAALNSVTSVAQPERVGDAQRIAQCLRGGCASPTLPAPSGTGPAFPMWAVVTTGIVGAASLLVLALIRPLRPRRGRAIGASPVPAEQSPR